VDGAGRVYGSTMTGGDATCSFTDYSPGCGTIFTIDAHGNLRTLHRFTGGPSGGAGPRMGLVVDDAGNLYGGTYGGGDHDFGILYRLDPAGNFSILHHFTGGADSFAPDVSFVDASGNLYGVAGLSPLFSACTQDCGIIFRRDPAGNLEVLHTFNGADGDQPSGQLLRDLAGNAYGVTNYGGDLPCFHPLGCGTVFRLATDGSLTTLHRFRGAEIGGDVPAGSLAADAEGNLYGTTLGGGSNLGGTLYRLAPDGQFALLKEFVAADGAEQTDHPDGQNPEGGVLLAPSGDLYGTTTAGGTAMWGVVYGWNLQTGAFRVLHTFTQAVGGSPVGPMVLDAAGDLIGTGYVGGNTNCSPAPGCGIVFRIDLPN
jgi:uncharacterized repeat protein (TIGR03803 family)